MSLPDCIRRLLPDNLPFVPVNDTEMHTPGRWSMEGVTITPILRNTPFSCNNRNTFAICDTDQQIRSPLQEDCGEVWYPIDRIRAALDLAERLKLDRVWIAPIEVNGTVRAPLGLIGKDARIAIVIAPDITWEDDDEEGDVE